jgi:hypothetical protein
MSEDVVALAVGLVVGGLAIMFFEEGEGCFPGGLVDGFEGPGGGSQMLVVDGKLHFHLLVELRDVVVVGHVL